jgi:hypothetical protein
MWKILTAVAIGLAVGALAAGWFALNQVSGLRSEIASQHVTLSNYTGRLSSDESDLSADESLIQQLQAKMGSLSTPADPLAAYDDICHSEFTNGSTGMLQTYYYPCTNDVETIPQPGS